MNTEMDALNMEEVQRLCRLRANRVTLMAVVLVWLGMIAWELARGSVPYFLIGMAPVIALVRFCIYKYYIRTVDSIHM